MGKINWNLKDPRQKDSKFAPLDLDAWAWTLGENSHHEHADYGIMCVSSRSG